MSRATALAEKVEPLIYEFPVKYQHDRTGWMAWPEGLPVTAIAPTKAGARRKLRGALRAYFRSTLRYGDPLGGRHAKKETSACSPGRNSHGGIPEAAWYQPVQAGQRYSRPGSAN